MSAYRRAAISAVVLVLTATALAASSPVLPEARVASAQRTAAEAFEHVERSLLEAPVLEIRVQVTSEGAFPSALRGYLTLGGANEAQLQVRGSFGEADVSLELDSDGRRLRGGSAAGEFDQPVPPLLNEAIVLGFTRMGILHNLARLTAGQPPDHMEGDVQEWVRVSDVASARDRGADGRELVRFDFALVVGGEQSGTASLWIDGTTRMPVRRSQTVQFETGEMQVTEIYEFYR